MIKRPFPRGLAIAFGTTLCVLPHAQLRIETSGFGSTQIPIAIAGVADEKLAPQQVSAIIKADLDRGGYFKISDTGNVMSENLGNRAIFALIYHVTFSPK